MAIALEYYYSTRFYMIFFYSNFYIKTIDNLNVVFLYLENSDQIIQFSQRFKEDISELRLKKFFEFKNIKEVIVDSYIINYNSLNFEKFENLKNLDVSKKFINDKNFLQTYNKKTYYLKEKILILLNLDYYGLKNIVFEYMPNMILEKTKVNKDFFFVEDLKHGKSLIVKYYIPEIVQNNLLNTWSKQLILNSEVSLGKNHFRHIITLFPNKFNTFIIYETDSDLHRIIPVYLIATLFNYFEYSLYFKQLMNVLPGDMLISNLSDWNFVRYNYNYFNIHRGWIHFEQFKESGTWWCVDNFVVLPDGTKKYVSEIVWRRHPIELEYVPMKFEKNIEWEKMIYDLPYSHEVLKKYFVKIASTYRPKHFFDIKK